MERTWQQPMAGFRSLLKLSTEAHAPELCSAMGSHLLGCQTTQHGSGSCSPGASESATALCSLSSKVGHCARDSSSGGSHLGGGPGHGEQQVQGNLQLLRAVDVPVPGRVRHDDMRPSTQRHVPPPEPPRREACCVARLVPHTDPAGPAGLETPCVQLRGRSPAAASCW